MMFDLDFLGAIVCDDVRREDNGKEMLIGVYSAEIVVASFPANLRVYFWVMVHGRRAGEHKFEMRVMGPNDVQFVRGEAVVQLLRNDRDGSLPLGPIPMQLQTPGDLRLEVRPSDGDWQEVKRLPVISQPG